MNKRIVSAVLAALMLISVAACTTDDPVTTDPDTVTETETVPADTGTEPVTGETTDAETEEPIIDEDPVFYTPVDRDPVEASKLDYSGLKWDETIKTANALANGVQGKFTDANRSAFTFRNNNMSMTYHILQNDKVIVDSLCNSEGVPYFENTMDTYIRYDDGEIYTSSESLFSGRMNSQRIGYYYYDIHFRDQNFINPETKKQYKEGEACIDLLKDHADGIKGGDVSGLKVSDGSLSFKVGSGAEPCIKIDGLEVSTEEFDAIQITLKTEVTDILSVLLLVNGEKAYSPDRQLVHRFDPGEATVVIPFSAMSKLYGKITGIKIALGLARGEMIEISEMRLIKRGGQYLPLLLERSYHTYPDKMHEQLRVVSTGSYKDGGYFGTKIEIPASNVRKMVMYDGNEEYNGIPEGFDFSSLEYIGFDIKGAGVFGLIMPAALNGTIKVELKDSKYIITREVKIGDQLNATESCQIYHRLYTTDSHQFNDLRKQAYIERNPLTDIQLVSNASGSKVFGYNKIRGCYDVFTTGAGFVDAYRNTPDKQIKVNVVVTGDGVVDRTIYFNIYTVSGALECSAVLDQELSLLPIPVQVSKNFGGEYEEKNYDPNDNSFGGEAYFPVTVAADESRRMTVLHLYQNWGNYPLKQLSSISFIQPYYHLSIGVTETNCIAPYFVFGKDGWTLPDFRSNSAPMWNSQPQHTSTGRLFFLEYKKESSGNVYLSESQSADIASSGPVYADVSMDYLSDDGSIEVTYRHVELPQTDENRTMYEIRMKVLKDLSISSFSKNFSIFKFDGRYAGAIYKKIGYLDENNECVTEDVNTKRKISRIVKLGTECPYVSVFEPVFTVPGSEVTNAVNFALIIKDQDITIGGQKYTGNLAFRENCVSNQTHIELTLDLDDVTLKAGDEINIDMVLLPWGETASKNDDNVRNVREDTCLDPYKVNVKVGTVMKDTYVPMVRAENNVAEFTLSGVRSNAVVRVYGFSGYEPPEFLVFEDGKWEDLELEGENGYDGYQVYYDEDGTYSFAFVLDMDEQQSYELRVKQ